MQRQHVDDVGRVVASLVAEAHQLRGDGVAVGLVVDQDAAERVPGLRVERFEEGPEVARRSTARTLADSGRTGPKTGPSQPHPRLLEEDRLGCPDQHRLQVAMINR